MVVDGLNEYVNKYVFSTKKNGIHYVKVNKSGTSLHNENPLSPQCHSRTSRVIALPLTRMHSSMMRTVRSSSRLLGGGGMSHCMLGYNPPCLGLKTPPARPLTFPLGMELEKITPPVPARPLNLPPGYGPGDPLTPQPPPGYGPGDSPVNRMTDTCKNITFANFVCGR